MKSIYYRFRIWFADLTNHRYNVTWFGADPTGRTDASQAFQRAIDHVALKKADKPQP